MLGVFVLEFRHSFELLVVVHLALSLEFVDLDVTEKNGRNVTD